MHCRIVLTRDQARPDGAQQGGLRSVRLIHGLGVHARGVGHSLDAGAGVAALAEKTSRGLLDAAPGVLTAPTPPGCRPGRP
jgi:hypothetical protein